MKSQTISANQPSTYTSASNLNKLKELIQFAEKNKFDDNQILDLIKLTFNLSDKLNFTFNYPTKYTEVPATPIIPYNPPNPPWGNPIIWCSDKIINNK